MQSVSVRQGGISLIELMAVIAIIGMLLALGAPEFQRYLLRAKAASIVIEAQPVMRLIQEYQGSIDKNRFRLELINNADGSISGCPAPVDSTCAAAGATPVTIVRSELLLITDGTVRVSAAPCYVDCPGFALNFSSDVNTIVGAQSVPPAPTAPATPVEPATPSSPAAPAEPVTPVVPAPVEPVPDASNQGKGNGGGKGQGQGGGKGKQGALEERPGRPVLSWSGMLFVPSAHAAAAAASAGSFAKINRVLYEFGELMRGKAYAVDNTACLLSTGTCAVTIKY